MNTPNLLNLNDPITRETLARCIDQGAEVREFNTDGHDYATIEIGGCRLLVTDDDQLTAAALTCLAAGA